MKYYIYIDESGVLHPNSSGDYFLFGGIAVTEENKSILEINYSNALLNIKSHKGIPKNLEMKASKMREDAKEYLLNNLRRNCEQIFVVSNIRKLRQEVFQTTKNINRHKNYMITKMIEQLIISGRLNECSEAELIIDNQNIAYNAMDNLESYLHITFNEDNYRYGDFYYDYDIDYIDFTVIYRDSRNDYLIQAADLISNTKYREYESESSELYKLLKEDSITLSLPLGRN